MNSQNPGAWWDPSQSVVFLWPVLAECPWLLHFLESASCQTVDSHETALSSNLPVQNGSQPVTQGQTVTLLDPIKPLSFSHQNTLTICLGQVPQYRILFLNQHFHCLYHSLVLFLLTDLASMGRRDSSCLAEPEQFGGIGQSWNSLISLNIRKKSWLHAPNLHIRLRFKVCGKWNLKVSLF